MTSLAVKIIIESVIQDLHYKAIPVYIVQSGDIERGNILVKTYADSPTTFYIHQKTYDFQNDSYTWEKSKARNENATDSILQKYCKQDTDCWCIDVEDYTNPFENKL